MDRWPINPRRVAVFAGMFILVLMVMDFNARLEELNLLKKHASALGAQATEAVYTQEALQTQVAYAGSDDAVQDWARGEAHYVQPDDMPVVPLQQPGTAPIQVTQPTPIPTPISNWQIWWNLFFGE